MLSTAISVVNDIEHLILLTIPGVEVHIRASLDGDVVVDVYHEGRLLAHNAHETLASAAQLAFGNESVRRLLRDAKSDKYPTGYIRGERWANQPELLSSNDDEGKKG